MSSKNKKNEPNRFIRVIRLIFEIPKIFESRLTHAGVDDIKPYRDIYYSTIFALGTAALAFMAQFLDKQYQNTWILIISVLLFGLALIIIIIIYFLRIIHTISWGYFRDKTKNKKINNINEINKHTSPQLINALQNSFDLMIVGAYLDLLLLFSLFGALLSYCSFIIINI